MPPWLTQPRRLGTQVILVHYQVAAEFTQAYRNLREGVNYVVVGADNRPVIDVPSRREAQAHRAHLCTGGAAVILAVISMALSCFACGLSVGLWLGRSQ